MYRRSKIENFRNISSPTVAMAAWHIKCQCCPHIETSKSIDWFLYEGNTGLTFNGLTPALLSSLELLSHFMRVKITSMQENRSWKLTWNAGFYRNTKRCPLRTPKILDSAFHPNLGGGGGGDNFTRTPHPHPFCWFCLNNLETSCKPGI